jgi:hypothetical protein
MSLFWEISLKPGLPPFWGFKPFLMKYSLNNCYYGSFKRLTMCSTISNVTLVGMPDSPPRASTTFRHSLGFHGCFLTLSFFRQGQSWFLRSI